MKTSWCEDQGFVDIRRKELWSECDSSPSGIYDHGKVLATDVDSSDVPTKSLQRDQLDST